MINPLLIKRKTLPNGIRFVQFPRSQRTTAQLSVVIEYGSISGTETNAGLAHFLEHMVGGGSEERIKATRSIEQNGGYLNFWTFHEYTMGYADVFREKLNETSQCLSKLFFENDLEAKKFDLEQKVILNEIDDSSDNPLDVVDEMLKKNLYKIHPVRHPILGYHKTVSQFSIDEIIETQQAHYTPQNTILILSGKYSDKDVELIEQNFVEIKKSKTALKRYKCTREGEPKKISSKSKAGISQTYLRLGYRTTSGKHPDNPTIELFSTIMGNGASSRLFRELREKRGLTYDIQASNCKGQDFGFFSVDCSVKPSKIKETTELILKEITNLKTKKISDNELLKGKNMIIGDYFRGIDDSPILHTGL
ncbi:MAG: M16 family metallopeptidase, partial [Candidatus Heimdallarchaeaceae archaeon]